MAVYLWEWCSSSANICGENIFNYFLLTVCRPQGNKKLVVEIQKLHKTGLLGQYQSGTGRDSSVRLDLQLRITRYSLSSVLKYIIHE